tara:strand:- start:1475 stop:1705 length:231 start_codon:yes stop_codon:yes gene_type:complete
MVESPTNVIQTAPLASSPDPGGVPAAALISATTVIADAVVGTVSSVTVVDLQQVGTAPRSSCAFVRENPYRFGHCS